MKSILLCEGKTDLILYSYYLNKVCGWESIDKKENRSFKKTLGSRLSSMKVDNPDTQQYAWYFRDDELVCMYAVGSKDNFTDALKHLAERGLIPKSKLGAYFSVISPNRTFDVGNKILESIPWEKYLGFHQTLHLLREMRIFP